MKVSAGRRLAFAMTVALGLALAPATPALAGACRYPYPGVELCGVVRHHAPAGYVKITEWGCCGPVGSVLWLGPGQESTDLGGDQKPRMKDVDAFMVMCPATYYTGGISHSIGIQDINKWRRISDGTTVIMTFISSC